MAAYSRFALPQIPMRKYMGTRTSSQKTKNRMRSNAMNVPAMPGAVVEPDGHDHADDQRGRREQHAEGADQPVPLPRRERDDERSHQGQERGDRDGPVLPPAVHPLSLFPCLKPW